MEFCFNCCCFEGWCISRKIGCVSAVGATAKCNIAFHSIFYCSKEVDIIANEHKFIAIWEAECRANEQFRSELIIYFLLPTKLEIISSLCDSLSFFMLYSLFNFVWVRSESWVCYVLCWVEHYILRLFIIDVNERERWRWMPWTVHKINLYKWVLMRVQKEAMRHRFDLMKALNKYWLSSIILTLEI